MVNRGLTGEPLSLNAWHAPQGLPCGYADEHLYVVQHHPKRAAPRGIPEHTRHVVCHVVVHRPPPSLCLNLCYRLGGMAALWPSDSRTAMRYA